MTATPRIGPSAKRTVRAAGFAAVVVSCLSVVSPASASASAARDLVRMAQTYEKSREDELALRRYTEALSMDVMCEDAYLGLASLRARRGDLREAERVYSAALERMPGLRSARLGRAYVRRALGFKSEAAGDLLLGMDDDPASLRILAGWYGEDGQTPAQLSVWRRIVAVAESSHDASLLREGRTMVRALVILVGTADPAASPVEDGGVVRRTISALARRGY